MNKITVKQRTCDWMAWINDDRRKWEAGKTKQEAVYELLVSHGLEMEILLTEDKA